MISIDNNKINSFAITLIKNLNSAGYEAWLVGGCVRDLLYNKEPYDFDICTNALPSQTLSLFNSYGYKTITTGIKYGTVIVLNRKTNEQFEITTYRSERNYTDGRHPEEIVYERELEKDLSRRDFTINAMAYNPITKELIDNHNGLYDLQNNKLNTVGNPDIRFKEDSLRMLRAIRFSIKYNLDIESNVLESINSNANLISNVSKERITQELEKILVLNKPIKSVFKSCVNLITAIIPEILPCVEFNQQNKYHKYDVYTHTLNVVDNCDTDIFEIKLAALLHDIGKPDTFTVDAEGWGHFYGHPEVSFEIAKKILKDRLVLTSEQTELTLRLIRYHDMTIECKKTSVKRAMNKHGLEFLNKWFILKQADANDHINYDKWRFAVNIPAIKELITEIINSESCFKISDLKINGNDIMELLEIKPCKTVGNILNALFEEVLNEEIKNEYNELKDRAIELYTDNI